MRPIRTAGLVLVAGAIAALAPTPSSAAPVQAPPPARATATLVPYGGVNHVRVTVSGAPSTLRSTSVQLYWYSFYPDPIMVAEERFTPVGTIALSGGKGSIDVPVTSALIRQAKPPGLLHTLCCDVLVPEVLGATKVGVGNGAPYSYYGPVVASSISGYLDLITRLAHGHAMSASGQATWAARMANGTSTRTSVAQAMVRSSEHRRYRTITLYQRWLNRRPTASEAGYWERRLVTDTTSGIDLAMAGKAAARDAGGTTNAQRGAHLAEALHLPASYVTNYTTKLDAGVPWATVVKDAYGSAAAVEKRIDELGPRSGYTPSAAALAGEWRRTGDERGPLARVLATVPSQGYTTYG